jgi:hypothetical protein
VRASSKAPQITTSVSDRKYGYIASLQGPIILTAPHGCVFVKGKPPHGTLRNHGSERYTSTIALSIAREINKIMGHNSASFIFWQTAQVKKVNKFDLEPNMLPSEALERSAFHQGLHKVIKNNMVSSEPIIMDCPDFLESNSNELHPPSLKAGIESVLQLHPSSMKPLLHLDFHGKHDRKEAKLNWDIDVGCEASKVYWDFADKPYWVYKMREHLGHSIDQIYEGITIKASNGNRKPRAEIDPGLHGFWNCELHTMTSQGSLMGIPTF